MYSRVTPGRIVEAAIARVVPYAYVTTHLELTEDPVSMVGCGLDRSQF